MKTDLQKYKDFFDEMSVKYEVEKDSNYLIREHDKENYWKRHEYKFNAIILHVDSNHLLFNCNPEVRVVFSAIDESFIAFEAWGE